MKLFANKQIITEIKNLNIIWVFNFYHNV